MNAPPCGAGFDRRRLLEGAVTGRAVPDPSAATTPTREQVPGTARFKRAEGIWFDDGSLSFATTGDETIRALRIATRRIETVDAAEVVPGTPLQGVGTITVSRSGDLFVCEDNYDNDPDVRAAPTRRRVGARG